MPTNPIAPTTAPAPATPAPKATATTTASTTAITPSPKPQVTQSLKKPADETPNKKATLTKQVLDPRFGASYAPLEIRFLTGECADQVLDLGFNVQEVSMSQSVNLEDGQGQTIQVGHQFNNVSPWSFNLSWEYWGLWEDVFQLAALCQHMQKIDEKLKRPPRLQFTLGVAVIDPISCNSLDIKLDKPLPRDKGMRHATVTATFKLEAGQGTKHQYSPPLAPNALSDRIRSLTETEREKQGMIGATRTALAPCLGKEGSEKVANLLKDNKLGDDSTLLSLDPNTFIQLAVAGTIPKETLAKPEFQEKLKTDLAARIAKSENGVTPSTSQQLAEALQSGDPALLPGQFTTPSQDTRVGAKDAETTTSTTLYERISGDYQTILTAIKDQKLSPNDEVFSPLKNPTAQGRLTAAAGCGLDLRNNGAPKIAKTEGSDAVLLAGINQAIANAKTDDDLKRIFSLPDNTPETVLRKLKNGVPYKTKDDFLAKSSYNQMGITGYSLWSSFSSHESAQLTTLNSFVTQAELSDDDIKKRFGVDDAIAKKIRNNGKPFATKEEFLKATSPDSTGIDGKGNEAWLNFEKNADQVKPKTGATL
jgi:hypothetical protein